MIEFIPVESRKPLIGQLIWFVFWLGVTLVGMYLTASPRGHGTHTQLGLSPCASASLLNRPCPGCGLTTSFTATIHGQFAQAFQAHLFGPILYGLFTVTALVCGYTYLRKIKFVTDTKGFNWSLGILVAVFVIFGAIRFVVMDDYNTRDQTTRSMPE